MPAQRLAAVLLVAAATACTRSNQVRLRNPAGCTVNVEMVDRHGFAWPFCSAPPGGSCADDVIEPISNQGVSFRVTVGSRSVTVGPYDTDALRAMGWTMDLPSDLCPPGAS